MFEDLLAASNVLSAALKQYLAACSAMVNFRNAGNGFGYMSQESLDALLNEIELTHTYSAQVLQARLAMNQVKNTIPTLTPIAILPSDILTQVFATVANMQPGFLEYKKPPKLLHESYPEALTHICSRWRRIALDMRWLWTRIDVPFDFQMASLGLLARAKAFADRADPLLLDLNIRSNTDNFDGAVIDAPLDSFCTSIAVRTRSLNVTLYGYFGNRHLSVVKAIFEDCAPGTLERLVIRSKSAMVNGDTIPIKPFEAPEDEDDRASLRINLSQQKLDECLLPVGILDLAGVCFHWNSQVYHDLTELSLYNPSDVALITESQLGQILGASPRLQTLSLCIGPVVAHSNASLRTAIHLNQLKVLNLGPMTEATLGLLFQLITPGPKTLQIGLNFSFDVFQALKSRLQAFLSGTRVKQLRFNFEGFHPYIQPAEFEPFGSLPHLEVLAFSHAQLARQGNGARLQQETDLPTRGPQLKILHLVDCKIDLDHLQRATAILPIQTLILSGCLVRLNPTRRNYIKAEKVDEEVAQVVPALEFLPLKSMCEWSPWRS